MDERSKFQVIQRKRKGTGISTTIEKIEDKNARKYKTSRLIELSDLG